MYLYCLIVTLSLYETSECCVGGELSRGQRRACNANFALEECALRSQYQCVESLSHFSFIAIAMVTMSIAIFLFLGNEGKGDSTISSQAGLEQHCTCCVLVLS